MNFITFIAGPVDFDYSPFSIVLIFIIYLFFALIYPFNILASILAFQHVKKNYPNSNWYKDIRLNLIVCIISVPIPPLFMFTGYYPLKYYFKVVKPEQIKLKVASKLNEFKEENKYDSTYEHNNDSSINL